MPADPPLRPARSGYCASLPLRSTPRMRGRNPLVPLTSPKSGILRTTVVPGQWQVRAHSRRACKRSAIAAMSPVEMTTISISSQRGSHRRCPSRIRRAGSSRSGSRRSAGRTLSGPSRSCLAAPGSSMARVARIDILACFEHPVAVAVPSIGGPAPIGLPRRHGEPHPVFADAA